jgi:hypothetical protein
MKTRDLTIMLVALAATAALFGLPIVISNLGASLQIEHAVPGGRIENLRWVHAGSEHGGARSLLPGESTSLEVGYFDTDKPLLLRFDLVVDGARVVLTSEQFWVLEPRETRRVVIGPGFAVSHPMTKPAK